MLQLHLPICSCNQGLVACTAALYFSLDLWGSWASAHAPHRPVQGTTSPCTRKHQRPWHPHPKKFKGTNFDGDLKRGWPGGAGGIPPNSNLPSKCLSFVMGLSPSRPECSLRAGCPGRWRGSETSGWDHSDPIDELCHHSSDSLIPRVSGVVLSSSKP